MDNNLCPKCLKDTLNWGHFESVDNGGYYDATCENCDFEGRQWWNMVFDSWEELREDGEYDTL